MVAAGEECFDLYGIPASNGDGATCSGTRGAGVYTERARPDEDAGAAGGAGRANGLVCNSSYEAIPTACAVGFAVFGLVFGAYPGRKCGLVAFL